MNATSQLPELSPEILSTVNWHNMKAAQFASVLLERFCNLDRQFTRWRQHEHLRLLSLLYVDLRKQRKRESSGLSSTCLSLPNNILTLQSMRNYLSLNR